MTDTIKFLDCRQGVKPKFHASELKGQLREWQVMRKWCEDQGWELGCDFWANAVISEAWYFKTHKQHIWFALRWSS